MKFSNREKRDLFFAGFMISLAFAILLSGGLQGLINLNSKFGLVFLISFFTAGLGFLLHELGHKYQALRYGLRAEFKAFKGMLWLAVGLSFFGFIFAAPGAVFISGWNISKEKNGKISLIGPVINIFLALVFFLIGFISENSMIQSISNFGFLINSLLAAFNMIPVMPFDGAKVLAWSKTTWFVTTAIAVLLFIFSFSF